jgi:uncharacterized damage-inducible protein DinB
MFKSLATMMAAYNEWANRRLYDAASHVADRDYRAGRGAFFGSLHGTLNHLMVADLIWMQRFTGEGDVPKQLDAILYQDFPTLRRAREALDRRIIRHIDDLTDAELSGTLHYSTTRSPALLEQELAPLLLHFFNHQTHHRGQAHAILTGLAGEAPSLDLLIYQRETGIGMIKGGSGNFSKPEKCAGSKSAKVPNDQLDAG